MGIIFYDNSSTELFCFACDERFNWPIEHVIFFSPYQLHIWCALCWQNNSYIRPFFLIFRPCPDAVNPYLAVLSTMMAQFMPTRHVMTGARVPKITTQQQ
ncbi:hypothetical protein CFOL_v3_19332 [Cephalotus follicularis]|uniref:Uncharacterized protein n=1 Tax=Cephalotus follicularis TaxID=3775 RepID=A0A1Q3C1S3_CEPFO|nr:hypothetical protein CFOL_v3_17582 [Cephalotus follicularis]GAV75856.1 hypothetical protein CFOL_v3_19332 [Cephalotus follicularis]